MLVVGLRPGATRLQAIESKCTGMTSRFDPSRNAVHASSCNVCGTIIQQKLFASATVDVTSLCGGMSHV